MTAITPLTQEAAKHESVMTLPDAIEAAQAADTAFTAALAAAGYESRWAWRVAYGPQPLLDAYLAKVSADGTMHRLFERDRGRA